MRTRIEVTFTPGTRSISTGIENLTLDDIRLIVNETQNEVICSSLAKSNVTSIVGGVVTFAAHDADGDDLHALAAGDKITFEIDQGKIEQVLIPMTSAEVTEMVEEIIAEENINTL